MQANFNGQEMSDIAKHGADTGWHGLTWYTDTCKLYNRFKDEMWDMLVDDANDYGCDALTLLAGFKGASDVCSATGFENLMTWYAAERISSRLEGNRS